MWSVESVANTFLGPPFGAALLAVAFVLPFAFDALSFVVAAALVAAIPGRFRAEVGSTPADPGRVDPGDADAVSGWRSELVEGFRWLWGHDLLRTLAVVLGVMNLAGALSGAVLVLYAQEVLGVSPLTFTLMGFGFAVGGIAGGLAGGRLATRLGSGTCLQLTLWVGTATALVAAASSWWPVTAVAFAVASLVGSTWNVVTVSLRQAVIPSHLLGRVNSVYRFLAWGMMPIGAILGGVLVRTLEGVVSRPMALRSGFLADAAVHAVLVVVAARTLTTARIEATRDAAAS